MNKSGRQRIDMDQMAIFHMQPWVSEGVTPELDEALMSILWTIDAYSCPVRALRRLMLKSIEYS